MKKNKVIKKQGSIIIRKATHGSPEKQLELGDRKIQCYVLEDGTAVLSGRGMQEALGLGQSHGTRLASFLSNKSITPFIDEDLAMVLSEPIRFTRPGRGGVVARGYEATTLTKVCRAVLDARRAHKLDTNPFLLQIAHECEILVAAFSDAGIVAAVYEITGYDKDKKGQEIQKIVAAYISSELLPWQKKFPDEFYREIFRLNNWAYDPNSVKRPGCLGIWTNKLVYDQLPPGVVDELKRKSPKNEKKRRRYHLHRWLTEDIGNPHLKNQLIAVVTLMNVSSNWRKFKELFARKFGTQTQLDLEEED
jgi:hypothetical protein